MSITQCCHTEYPICCYDHDIEKLQELSFLLKSSMTYMGDLVIKDLKYGYPSDFSLSEYQIYKYYKVVLDRHIKSLLTKSEPCLKENVVQCLVEAIERLTFTCCDVVNTDLKCDSSDVEEWIINNPRCVAREKWEKILYEVIEPITADVELREIYRDIVADVIFRQIDTDITYKIAYTQLINSIVSSVESREQLCEQVADINLAEKNCKIKTITETTLVNCLINYDQRSEEQCKITYELLNKDICTLSFESYKNLINCGFSATLINSINECGITVDYDFELKCPTITKDETKIVYDNDVTDLLNYSPKRLAEILQERASQCITQGIKYLDDSF